MRGEARTCIPYLYKIPGFSYHVPDICGIGERLAMPSAPDISDDLRFYNREQQCIAMLNEVLTLVHGTIILPLLFFSPTVGQQPKHPSCTQTSFHLLRDICRVFVCVCVCDKW